MQFVYINKFFPISYLSQNFLIDKRIIKKIIQFINPCNSDCIIEVGSGLGALTFPLANLVNFFTIIEIDKRLVKFLSSFNILKNKVNFINKDILKVNLKILSLRYAKKIKIVGNIPFHITKEFMFYLFKYFNFIKDVYFMLQKEVAYRLFAQPNSKNYCRISIICQYFFKVFILMDIKNVYFYPVPKVNVVFLHLVSRKLNYYKLFSIKYLYIITQYSFNQRRKKIFNSLKKIFPNKFFLGKIDYNLRAENLTIKEYCYLSNILYLNKNFFVKS